MRRELFFLSTLYAGCMVPSACKAPEAMEDGERKPMNIVYIMCDDHSYQTVSAYDNRFTETPNIDRIAAEGVRFTNSFVANSLSGPSRACLLTGKHSHKNGFTDNEHGIFDGSQQTVQQLLRDAGYTTAMVGKWHLVSEPTGFDYWNILTGQGNYYNPTFIDNGEYKVVPGYATNVTTDIALDWLENGRDKSRPFCLFLHHKAPHRTWMPDLCDLDLYNDVVYPLPETFYDDYEGRKAAALQEMSILKDMNPVYDLKMADAENEIHTPENSGLEQAGRWMYSPSAEGELVSGKMTPGQFAVWNAHYSPIIEKFKKDSLSGNALYEWKYQQYMHDYCRVIHSVDRNVGRVYDYLREHDLLENTIIIYTSDQGFYMGEHGFFDKRFMYEESFRTPLLVRMPDSFKTRERGTDIDGFVQNIDHAPTFLEVAGAEIPSDIQGESYLRLLKGHDRGWRKSLYYHYHEYPAEHSVRRHYGVRTARWSLMHFYNDIDEWELFDLKNDPRQLHNVYGQRGYERVTRRLRKELDRLQKLYDDPVSEREVSVDWISPLPGNSAWRGESVNGVIGVRSSIPVDGLTLKSGDLVCGSSVIDASRVKLNFLSYVTGDELLEQYNQCGARDTVNYRAISVADMIDDRPSISLDAAREQPLWMSVSIPYDAAPGRYRGSLYVCGKKGTLAELNYSVKVCDRVLPPLSESPFHLDLWQNPYAVARYHGVSPWSREHFECMEPVMRMLADAGQKVITATIMDRPWNGQTEDPFGPMVTKIRKIDGSWLYDYAIFDKWVEFMSSLGIDGQINCYSLIPWALTFDFFDQATDSISSVFAEPGSLQYEEYWGCFIKDFAAHLKEKGWFEKTYLAMDERSEESMSAALRLIRKVEPDFKVALAGNYHESIADEIDDLCIAFGAEFPEGVVNSRRSKGQISTYYTCCSEKYPNTFLACNPLEATWLPLVALSRDVDGYLRWAFNSWTADPMKDARFRTWAAGDCYMVYPGGVSSVRFERLKEGLQDYLKASILLEEWGRGSGKASALEKALKMFTKEELETKGPERALETLRKAMDR